ncbi:hypothetical protein [Clostridium butyricum]|uniref:hypothetical protein n=1 Tax=Clostridium butyricum TaxID=1492 RepID=UPI002103925C|nr:hypothetical protein [Clostridium butyricum]MCQ2011974.1 hypothetical protein [Clostridium butyricum]MCQ2027806.1 hypothetical protein [Clostridium butyricum]
MINKFVTWLLEILECDDNTKAVKKIVRAILLMVFMSPSLLYVALYNESAFKTYGDWGIILLCLIFNTILFVIVYYSESLKGISYNSENKAEIKKRKISGNAIKALADMSIISIVLVIVYGIMTLLDNEVIIKVKIGLIIIIVMVIAKMINGIYNYFKVDRNLDDTIDEVEKEKALLKKEIKEKKNQH